MVKSDPRPAERASHQGRSNCIQKHDCRWISFACPLCSAFCPNKIYISHVCTPYLFNTLHSIGGSLTRQNRFAPYIRKYCHCLKEGNNGGNRSKARDHEASGTASDGRRLRLDWAGGARSSARGLLGSHRGNADGSSRDNRDNRSGRNGGTSGSRLAGRLDDLGGCVGRGGLGVAVDAAGDRRGLVDGSDGSDNSGLAGGDGLSLLAARHTSGAVDDLGDDNGHGDLRAGRLDILAGGRNRSRRFGLVARAEGGVRREDLGGDLANRAVGDCWRARGDRVDCGGGDCRRDGSLG